MTLSFPYLDSQIFLNFTFPSIPLIYNQAINRVGLLDQNNPKRSQQKCGTGATNVPILLLHSHLLPSQEYILLELTEAHFVLAERKR